MSMNTLLNLHDNNPIFNCNVLLSIKLFFDHKGYRFIVGT